MSRPRNGRDARLWPCIGLLGRGSIAVLAAFALSPNLAVAGWSDGLRSPTGLADDVPILLVAREGKPEPGTAAGGGGDGRGGGGDGGGGGGEESGDARSEAGARPITDPALCEGTPIIDGRGGGLATPEQAALCYATVALTDLGAHARTAFAALADGLVDDDPRNRRRATSDIGQISVALAQATPILLDALGAADLRVQKTAVKIVNDIGAYAAAVVPALDRVAADEDRVVARAAVQALADLGPYGAAGLPTLARSLNHPDLGVRYYASSGMSRVDADMRITAHAIGRLLPRYGDASSDAIRRLASALRADRSAFRGQAVLALATIGPEGEARVERLAPADRDVDTVRALGEISRFSTAAVPTLVEALADPAYHDLREAVSARVTDGGGSRALYAGIGLGSLLEALGDARPDVRRTGAEAVREVSITASEASATLDQAPRDDIFVSRTARAARRAISTSAEDAVPVLLEALKDEDPDVRRAAVQTLGQLGQLGSRDARDAVPALLATLKSAPVTVQSEAALALGRIGAEPSAVVPALADALTHPDPAVRFQAARALSLLGDRAAAAKPGLENALAEGDVGLRFIAARTLLAIDPEADVGDPDSLSAAAEQEVAQLLAVIKAEDPQRKRQAVVTLRHIGPAAVAGVPDLVAALVAAEPPLRGELAASLRAISAAALAEVPELVEDLRRGDAESRVWAAEALGRMGADANAARATLIEVLERPDLSTEVRFAVAEAFGDIGSYTTAVTRALAGAALRDADPEVRESASKSLREQAEEA